MLNKHRQDGFSLVELLAGIVIVSLLFAIAAPNFSVWIQNQQIRTAAESILNGLQLARSEAVKSNGTATFNLCAPPSASWEVVVASGTAPAPAVSLVCGAASIAAAGVSLRVQEHTGQEGSRNASVLPTTTTVIFNNLGRVVGAAAEFEVTNPIVGAEGRGLNVIVGVGGTLRMCDPSALLAIGDPRRCTP